MEITIKGTPKEIQKIFNVDRCIEKTARTNKVPTVSVSIGGEMFS